MQIIVESPAPPLALVKGSPVIEMPGDLYIPPDFLRVLFETFEGPLDLLLYLIRRNNLDVLDIPMASLTRQYMDYVEAMHEHQLELAGEYLLMAALLIEIKSRMLLPRRAKSEEAEVDPRAELVRRLIEYERMKRAAQALNDMPQAGRDFSLLQVRGDKGPDTRLPEVNSDDLRNAWLGLMARARVSRHHRITREQLSVREHMSRILRVLQPLRFVRFEELFEIHAGVPVLVVNFLAVLELAREALIQVTQQGAYAPIYVKSNHGLATV